MRTIRTFTQASHVALAGPEQFCGNEELLALSERRKFPGRKRIKSDGTTTWVEIKFATDALLIVPIVQSTLAQWCLKFAAYIEQAGKPSLWTTRELVEVRNADETMTGKVTEEGMGKAMRKAGFISVPPGRRVRNLRSADGSITNVPQRVWRLLKTPLPSCLKTDVNEVRERYRLGRRSLKRLIKSNAVGTSRRP